MQNVMHLEQLQSQISVGYIVWRLFSGVGYSSHIYLFINTKATGTTAVHFKLLFQNQWSEAETWGLSHQHSGHPQLSPVPGVSQQMLLTALPAAPCSHFTGTQLDHEMQPAGQCPLPVPWQLVPLQSFTECPSPQGCGTEGRGAEARRPGADRASG